jgi:hypothetical protein|tara:strand:+ start:438 stop:653 length:216 start_codon:yes stop_codon:yes gene_type:complete
MSAEKITSIDTNSLPPLSTSEKGEEVRLKRVDINDLLARARKKSQKENFVNLIFLGIFCSLILVVGTILSF